MARLATREQPKLDQPKGRVELTEEDVELLLFSLRERRIAGQSSAVQLRKTAAA